MTEFNWGAFRAKFNGKEQATFEWLCYLLFCAQFGKPFGILRYKNQTGIETEPIEVDGHLVGFQAKFYDTPVSANKADIIDSLTKAKAKNKDLSRILVYLNREFSESTNPDKKQPRYIEEVESAGRDVGIEVQWKVPSHLEAQLASHENRHIAQHFFSLDGSVIDFVNALTEHARGILLPIRSSIPYDTQSIKVDRHPAIEQLRNASNESPAVILAGVAGVGKTAVIKDFYSQIGEDVPFYVFKSIEFNAPSIAELLENYGKLGLIDFIDAHSDIETKYVVIDSAERLSDFEDSSALQEFLSALLANNWRIVFTTRYSYLEDLRFQFLEVYQIPFASVIIDRLPVSELSSLAKGHGFTLPSNPRMLELLRVPFYLAEYLRAFGTAGSSVDYEQFRNHLWDTQICKTSYRRDNIHYRREDCFLAIASTRAASGQPLVRPDGLDTDILARLETDEIIQFDKVARGYFITHDIYEEWALAKILDNAYHQSKGHAEFLTAIGHSLPVRRAFRTWLTDRLLTAREETSSLIQAALSDPQTQSFWKDEFCVSVLLSDYAEDFLSSLEPELLARDQELFIRLLFLLRIACKDVDEEFLCTLGISTSAPRAIQVFFTKPRGAGWSAAIQFILKHCKTWKLTHINAILPVLVDWTSKNKSGPTTGIAGRIALYYYHELARNDALYGHRQDELTDRLLRVILQTASELKAELEKMFQSVLLQPNFDTRHPYHPLIERVLTSITDAVEVARVLPSQVLKLAEMFWTRPKPRDYWDHGSSIDVEQHFDLRDNHFDYFPSSALQTPMFLLLRQAPQESINFIVSFTNKAVAHYAKSGLDGPVQEVQLFIDESNPTSQYMSNRLWNTYRGTQVSTYLLESIHMALEEWLLDVAKHTSIEVVERWCLSLLQDSHSASLTAVVASVVQAYPYKLERIALILFRTKEFFEYDTARFVLDQSQKANLQAFGKQFPTNWENEIHEHDRLAACDDEHRRSSLEHLAFKYQLMKDASESDGHAQARREAIWHILGRHYSELPDSRTESHSDKAWRLCLARMDSRKMTASVQEINGQQAIAFTPEIDPELKSFSERATEEYASFTKHLALRMWSEQRFQKAADKYKEHGKYDNDPQLVLTETRAILEELQESPEEPRLLMDAAIPAYACAVLIRDFHASLSAGDLRFCRNILIDYASLPLAAEEYRYQFGDGTEPAITVLPQLIQHFPDDQSEVVALLILLLCNPWEWTSVLAIRAVLYGLWAINSGAAKSCLLGYLLLKPKYQAVRESTKRDNLRRKIYKHSESAVLTRFRKEHGRLLGQVASGNFGFEALKNVHQLDLYLLNTAFQLMPLQPADNELEDLLEVILNAFSQSLYSETRHGEARVDYALRSRFLQKFAHFVLSASPEKIPHYLDRFIVRFQASQAGADLLQEFVTAEDHLNRYDSFWAVWGLLYNRVLEIATKDHRSHYTAQVIHNYLLAWQFWKRDARTWHSLKDREKLFFKKVAEQMGHHPAVLYSLAKFLNDIGSEFLNDGIEWIAAIIDRNKHLGSAELETNTIYYLEMLLRRYILTNRREVKTTPRQRQQILTILDFLVDRGSLAAYLLREDIL